MWQLGLVLDSKMPWLSTVHVSLNGLFAIDPTDHQDVAAQLHRILNKNSKPDRPPLLMARVPLIDSNYGMETRFHLSELSTSVDGVQTYHFTYDIAMVGDWTFSAVVGPKEVTSEVTVLHDKEGRGYSEDVLKMMMDEQKQDIAAWSITYHEF
jgi:hypothetical protein